jgi:hypothetical protein
VTVLAGTVRTPEEAEAAVEAVAEAWSRLSNAGAFIEAGAVAVGVGSALTGASDVESQAQRLRDQVLAAKSSS